MIVDARKAELPGRTAFDLVIVGAGAAGIAVALALAKTRITIALVEAGGDRFSAKEQEFYASDDVVPETHSPAHLYRRRILGGSTSIWGGRCIPFDPIDFEARDWMAHARWPISHEDVVGYLPAAMQLAEGGLPEFDASRALPGQPGPMVDGVPADEVILDRVERFSKPTHFGRAYRARLAKAERLTVFTHAPVTQILVQHESGHVRGVRINAGGRFVDLAAPRVVVAVGGIETARLLLASNEARPLGLGNESGLVGRFYQCHIECQVGTLRFLVPPQSVRLDYALSHDAIYCRRYVWLSPKAQREHRLAGLVMRPEHPLIVDPAHRHPVLSAMYLVKNFIVPEYARKISALEHLARAKYPSSYGYYGAHLRNIAFGTTQLARFAFDWTRRRILAERKLPTVVLRDPRGIYPAAVTAEQEPNYDSRVLLGDSRDSLGMPRVAIDWRTTDADYDRLAAGLRMISQAFAASNSVRYEVEGADPQTLRGAVVPIAGHHIGTARMAESPATGVCNRNGEVFGVPGLYIAGAAVFPTSSFANPTLTLIALALRLADHLRSGAHTLLSRSGTPPHVAIGPQYAF
jgi:choline dehydrogenase-like flavoprotein